MNSEVGFCERRSERIIMGRPTKGPRLPHEPMVRTDPGDLSAFEERGKLEVCKHCRLSYFETATALIARLIAKAPAHGTDI